MRRCHYALLGSLLLVLTGCGSRTPTNPTNAPFVVVKPSYPPPPSLPDKDAPPGYFTPVPPGAVSWMKADDEDPIPQDREKSKKREAAKIEWHKTAMLGSFEKHGNTKAAWADLARAALTAQAVSFVLKSYRQEEATETSKRAIEAAIAAGCDDPQVRYYYFMKYKDNSPETARELKQLADRFDAEKYPAYRRMHSRWNACAFAADLIPDANPKLKPSPTNRRAQPPRADFVPEYESVWASIADLAAVRDEEAERSVYETAIRVCRIYDKSGHDRKEGFNRVMKAVETGGGSVWLRKMIEGEFYVEYAWDARGEEVAGEVPEEAWPVFQSRLRKAEAALEAAWEADSTRPEPCLRLITVSLGLGHEREHMEKWFRRAMTADPDSYGACVMKLNYLHPKWHGSKEEMRAFGRQCARTQNWDAGLPLILLQTLTEDNGIPDFDWIYFQWPNNWAECRELFEPYLMAHPDDQYVRTVYGKVCLAANKFGSAYFHFSKLDGKPWIGPKTFPDEERFKQAFERAQHIYFHKEVKKGE